MDNRNLILYILACLVIFLVGTTSVFAYGISSPYTEKTPLKMYPGQTKEVAFNLQNCPSLGDYCEKEDVNVVVSFEEGNEIAEIISGLEYNVPYGTADTNIILKVSIPEDGNVGDSYNVKFSIGAAPSGEEGGNVQLGVRYNVDFPVNVVAKEEAPTEPVASIEKPEAEKISIGKIAIIILIVVAVIAVVYFLLRKKK